MSIWNGSMQSLSVLKKCLKNLYSLVSVLLVLLKTRADCHRKLEKNSFFYICVTFFVLHAPCILYLATSIPDSSCCYLTGQFDMSHDILYDTFLIFKNICKFPGNAIYTHQISMLCKNVSPKVIDWDFFSVLLGTMESKKS